MNPDTLAKAYRAIGQGYYEAADVLLEAAGAPAADDIRPLPKPTPSAGPLPTISHSTGPNVAMPEFPPMAEVSGPQGSLEQCPKHRIPYTPGTYGPYCKEVTNDPAWGKQKGDRLWCRITPKNAAEWLHQHAA